MTISTQTSRIHDLEHQLAEHRRDTAVTATIERAKGMLMVCHGIAEERASALLNQWAVHYDLDIWVLAMTLVHLGVHNSKAAHGGQVDQ